MKETSFPTLRWSADPAAGFLRRGAVALSFAPDPVRPGGIVLTKVAARPEGAWSLAALPLVEAEAGLRPTAIGEGFADGEAALAAFAIPASVRAIGRAAFRGCEAAAGPLALPPGLEELGEAAFDHCWRLTGALEIPALLRDLPADAFHWCGGFSAIRFAPGSRLRSVGPRAFKHCWGVRGTVDFSPCEALERIDPTALRSCEPERVEWGARYRARVAAALRAADEACGYPRAPTDWLAGSLGIGVHWTSRTTDAAGRCGPFEEAVEAFDVPRFVSQVRAAGARHVIFTSTWAEQRPPAPCPALDRVLPGRTARRNLLREIADALAAVGIRTILYYNHSCNGRDDPPWMDACGYAPGSLERFGARIVEIVRDLALAAGPNVAGWWFDSPSSVSAAGVGCTAPFPLGAFRYPFREISLAAKAANPEAVVSVNSQGGTFLYTTCQEYFSGEDLFGFPCCGPTTSQGMRTHLWSQMDNVGWVHTGAAFAPLRYSDDALGRFLRRHLGDGGAVTLNVDVDRSGLLNPAAIDQLARLAPQPRGDQGAGGGNAARSKATAPRSDAAGSGVAG